MHLCSSDHLLAFYSSGLCGNVGCVADFDIYPGYTGDLKSRGKATVRFNANGSFLFKVDAVGVGGSCTGCGVHVHTGSTYDNATLVGPHHWNMDTFGNSSKNDPWDIFGFYNSDYAGKTTTAFVGDSGLGYSDHLARAVVLHSAVSVLLLKNDSL
jgi:hypothetical protein